MGVTGATLKLRNTSEDQLKEIEKLQEALKRYDFNIQVVENMAIFTWDEQKQHEINSRGAGRKQEIFLGKKDVKKIKEMREKGMTAKQVAERYNMSVRSLYRKLKELEEE